MHKYEIIFSCSFKVIQKDINIFTVLITNTYHL